MRTDFTYETSVTGRIRNLNHYVPAAGSQPARTISSRTYGYDALDRMRWFQKSASTATNPLENGRGESYGYDAAGQLTSAAFEVANPAGANVANDAFSYDGVGNRTSMNGVAYTLNPSGLNQYATAGSYGTVGGDPNSATSQWFINLADNSHKIDNGTDIGLDVQNGGFTVFGRVAGTGMTVADAIAAVPRYDFGTQEDPTFSSLPLRDYTSPNFPKVPNLVSIPELTRISPLQFSASSNNTNVATVSVSGTNLLVDTHQLGSAQISVTATDLDGATVSLAFTVNVIAMPGHLANISTRLQVGTNQDVLIAGFYVRGGTSKRLMVRGIGPSLTSNGQPVPGRLADPLLELHNSVGATIATNNNWGDANAQQITDTGIAPASPLDSAILTTVPSNADGVPYTAVLQGVNTGTGIGSVEVYDLDSGPGSFLVNISTRGQVGTDNNVLIAGFIITGGDAKRVLIRGIGPSLGAAGIASPLANPTIELHDANGTQIDANDNWESSPQKSEIEATGVPPSDPKESAMLRTLAPSSYTAIIKGVSNTTGVGSIEVYQL